MSKQWLRLLAERLDAVAVLYRVAAMVADTDPHQNPVRMDHYRHGPYDMLLTLSKGRSIGLLRQGPTLPTSKIPSWVTQQVACLHLLRLTRPAATAFYLDR